jgi:hypothetical protein
MLRGGICSSEFKAIPLISVCPDFASARMRWSNFEFLRNKPIDHITQRFQHKKYSLTKIFWNTSNTVTLYK